MKPGDIILIRFPQADLLEGKLRPALTLAVAPGNHPDLLLALIPSRDYQAVPNFDEMCDPAEDDFAQTGLKTHSVVRLARLASVQPSVVSARLGRISPERLRSILNRLVRWLQEASTSR